MFEKLKSLLANDVVFYSLLLVLVAVASFGLGRQSVGRVGQVAAPIGAVIAEYPAIIPNNQAAAPIEAVTGVSQGLEADGTVVPGGGAVVASKSGTKYHLPTCPGAKQIKPDNLISFTSIVEAEAAGYTPATNCKF